ncbi:hypothetical protein IMZ48_22610 [Candidatus Bathyarchaeota archaeon]|nr:hypothetical protein [Candidatus Bathyarchaeota archaeon]
MVCAWEGCPSAILGELTTPGIGMTPNSVTPRMGLLGNGGETLLVPGKMAMYTTRRRARSLR